MPKPDDNTQLYADLEHTFNTPGWSRLVEGWKEEQKWLPEFAFYNAKTVEDLELARVRHKLLSELISLADDIRQQREALEEAEQEPENV